MNILNNKHISLIILIFIFFTYSTAFSQEQRFPKPEFYTSYEIPETSKPEPRSSAMAYFDLFVLVIVLSLATWFIFKKRSRRWLLALSVFAVLYFGFYRNGCICSVGSIQNVSLSLFGDGYSISLTVLFFFLIPLLFALAVGRVFCAAACPLGIIQDLVVIKPLRISKSLRVVLGLFPFIYLGLAILYAATGSDFIICRYDPFVSFFRLSGEFHLIVLGISFLLLGIFIGRPFCRFLCPYGALLKICSLNSKYHLSITSDNCINCKLCKDSCPFEAIDYPTEINGTQKMQQSHRKFLFFLGLLPLLIATGVFTMTATHSFLARVHPDVRLAQTLASQPDLMKESADLDIQTFMASERTFNTLVSDAIVIQKRFKTGSQILGGFLGLVLGLSLINVLIYRRRDIYEANRGNCYSCGRCMKYCPVGKPEHPYFIENPEKWAESLKLKDNDTG